MAGTKTTNPWDAYPRELPFSIIEADQQARYQTLQIEAARLFAGRDDVEIWKPDSGEIVLRHCTGPRSIR